MTQISAADYSTALSKLEPDSNPDALVVALADALSREFTFLSANSDDSWQKMARGVIEKLPSKHVVGGYLNPVPPFDVETLGRYFKDLVTFEVEILGERVRMFDKQDPFLQSIIGNHDIDFRSVIRRLGYILGFDFDQMLEQERDHAEEND